MREQLQEVVDQLHKFNVSNNWRLLDEAIGKLEAAILAASPPCTCPTLDGIKVVGSSCPVHGFPSCEMTSPPAVSVKPGWVAKDTRGPLWFDAKPICHLGIWCVCVANGGQACWTGHIIADPWPDHPNGGPKCLLEVKP